MPTDIDARFRAAVDVLAKGGGLIGIAIVVVSRDGSFKVAGTGHAIEWPGALRSAARHIELEREAGS